MIVIHIGFPKAGSSTIQAYLSSNQCALQKLSVDYPNLGRMANTGHHQFAHELSGRMEHLRPQLGGLAELKAHLRETPFDTTLISSECFTPCSAEQVAWFAKSLSDTNQQFRIIQIIRNLVDIAPSSYAQRIRFGGLTNDFDDFFELLLSRQKFNAFEVATRWGGAFGWDTLRVRSLDTAHLFNGDLIDDFLYSSGIDPDQTEMRAMLRGQRANESSGWKALEALRALFGGQSGLADNHPLVQRVQQTLQSPRDLKRQKKNIGLAAEAVAAEIGWNQDRGRYLTLAQAERLQRDFASNIQALNDHLTVKLPTPPDLDARGFAERDFLPCAQYIPTAELSSFYEAVVERLTVDDESRRRAKLERDAKGPLRRLGEAPSV